MEQEFLYCTVCGNIVVKLKDSGLTPQCCGRDMIKLEADTVDASKEKHVPVVMLNGRAVSVFIGEEPHPMTDDHYIQWILIKTNKGFQVENLKPGDSPQAIFYLDCDEEVLEAYAYCNIHKLWKSDQIEDAYKKIF